ncbi:hypothetical protein BCV73_17390 [Paenibacillus sp. SSG-1]|uniref:metallophosphoesterase n=1 Tax=Paenibacillus sp. SSG-1 TaxID=1443669 RepID=UPI000B7DB672|nr:metallophosphoesterase [Paenibacillus sp. SSG-1]OXL84684.1 hypothetical protein BCV73_17390 [Paenibacillus sp. SSG-1]
MVAPWLVWAGAGVAAAAAALYARMSYEARLELVQQADVRLERLPKPFDGCKLLFISDLHSRRLTGKTIRQLAGTVDWVILGGDIMERNVPLSQVEHNLRLLAEIAPVYAVYGNHDYKADPEGLEKLMNACGVTLLRDENVPLLRNGARLWLTGVDYPRYKRNDYPPVPQLPVRDAGAECRILAVHDPAWLQKQKTIQADLVLAGHTHGGQITLPWLGPIRLNQFYRKYASGWFEWEQPEAEVRRPRMLISRGFGTRRVPLRLCCPAEMHVLTLRTESIEKTQINE